MDIGNTTHKLLFYNIWHHKVSFTRCRWVSVPKQSGYIYAQYFRNSLPTLKRARYSSDDVDTSIWKFELIIKRSR